MPQTYEYVTVAIMAVPSGGLRVCNSDLVLWSKNAGIHSKGKFVGFSKSFLS